MNKKITYCHIQSLWNFVIFIILLKKNKFDPNVKYIIIYERDIIPLHFKKEFKDILEFKLLNSAFKKINFLYYLKKNNQENNSVIKFLNYSNFGQLICGLRRYDSITFIDDGSTFINSNSSSISYESLLRNKIKKIVSFKNFQPDFMNFHSVDKAYIFNNDLFDFKKGENSFQLIELNKIISMNDFINISDKIIPNIESLKEFNCETLVLGAALVEHGFLTPSIYNKNILDIFKTNKNILFKPHPSESNTQIKNVNFLPNDFNKYPIELLINIIKPEKVISFGSTTSFLLMNMKLNIELEIYFPKKLMSKKLELIFKKLQDRINIYYI